ncbi:hypothetical protein [Subtercola sp. RTI3]|uniref:hypothetical protein n=1 Tax=Subtercola sp. RTI3 TaxID=3048639 RepID=UPI002B22E3A7|nr:hypothetical protein [Subtercola sp. RTI3]MEA9986083.1 hypothetical protein [Subtercola sp. RTI3]
MSERDLEAESIRDMLGHNIEMPSRLNSPDMPPGAAAAHKAVSSSSRLATIRYLFDFPGARRSDIVSATGMSAAAARTALIELEEFGYVTADVGVPRNGRNVRYTVNRAALTDDLTAFVAWTLR